jgi:hypothetical protein
MSVVKEFAIHSADTSDQSIRRRSLNKFLGVSSSPLGCDDQRTVLNEAVGVTEVVDVLSSRPVTRGVATSNSAGAAIVGHELSAPQQLSQLGANLTISALKRIVGRRRRG